MKTIFYNLLFDENASCHFAFGSVCPSTVKHGTQIDEADLAEIGANISLTHVDFMVGSSDLNIDGVKANGEVVSIFRFKVFNKTCSKTVQGRSFYLYYQFMFYKIVEK